MVLFIVNPAKQACYCKEINSLGYFYLILHHSRLWKAQYMVSKYTNMITKVCVGSTKCNQFNDDVQHIPNSLYSRVAHSFSNSEGKFKGKSGIFEVRFIRNPKVVCSITVHSECKTDRIHWTRDAYWPWCFISKC